jgi:hypothetical protein
MIDSNRKKLLAVANTWTKALDQCGVGLVLIATAPSFSQKLCSRAWLGPSTANGEDIELKTDGGRSAKQKTANLEVALGVGRT